MHLENVEERVRVVFPEQRLDVRLPDDGAEEFCDGVTPIVDVGRVRRIICIRIRPREHSVDACTCSYFHTLIF